MLISRRLPDSLRKRLENYHLDIFLDKHEMWRGHFARSEDCRIALLGQHDVLMPLTAEELENVEVLNAFLSPDQQTMTLFLADHNYDEALPGLLLLAERLPSTGVFVTVVFHASHHVSKLYHERNKTYLTAA